ncbi:MAG: glycoside hydrolase family 127 protein, partial [Clostridia bacterium]|nr:glycoside hydrolase family 127 protein [Clostridia bacterium]
YNESCAAIALFFFALRMRELDRNAVYGDVAERVLYNGLLSSTSLDGKSFFYENPLEINLSSYDRETAVAKGERERLPITTRLEAFDCSCCPPNVNRFFARFSGFLALEEDGRLTVEQYVSARIASSFGQVNVREEYAVSGKVTLSSENYSAETLAFRLPLWSKSLTVVLNGKEIIPKKENGYAVLAVPSAFVLELDFHIAPVLVSASARVRENAGKVALTYGPLVYCLEGIDNGEHLWELSLPVSSLDKAVKTQNPLYRLPDFTLQGCRLSSAFSLYFPAGEETEAPCPLVFRPYFTFANRGKTDMSVWVRKK